MGAGQLMEEQKLSIPPDLASMTQERQFLPVCAPIAESRREISRLITMAKQQQTHMMHPPHVAIRTTCSAILFSGRTMSTTLFDTHAYIKRLERAGITQHQAQAHATSLAQAMDNQLAKTADVNLLKEGLNHLKADVNVLKTDVNALKIDVNALKTDVNVLKVDVNALKTDVNTLKTDVNVLKVDVSLLKSDLREFRAQVSGQFSLLKWMLGFLIASTAGVWLQLLK
jgi:archaellum component FlaC